MVRGVLEMFHVRTWSPGWNIPTSQEPLGTFPDQGCRLPAPCRGRLALGLSESSWAALRAKTESAPHTLQLLTRRVFTSPLNTPSHKGEAPSVLEEAGRHKGLGASKDQTLGTIIRRVSLAFLCALASYYVLCIRAASIVPWCSRNNT